MAAASNDFKAELGCIQWLGYPGLLPQTGGIFGGLGLQPHAITKGKAAEIAADFMTTFYHVQVGALETQEFRSRPVPFWLVCFSDAVKGPMRQMFFVLLPDGTVVELTVAKRL
jgi:hypothetical protein